MTRLYLNYAHDWQTTGWYSGGYEESLSTSYDSTRYARVGIFAGGIFKGAASSYGLVTRWYSAPVGVATTVTAGDWTGKIYAYHNDPHADGPNTVTCYLKKRTAAGVESALGSGTFTPVYGATPVAYTITIACSAVSLAVGDRVYLYCQAVGDLSVGAGTYSYLYYRYAAPPFTDVKSYLDTPSTVSFADSAVDDDLTVTWTTEGTVYDSLTTQWNVAGALSDDLDVQWSVYTTLEDDLEMLWDVLLTDVGKSADIQWNVESTLTAVSDDLDVQWNVLSEVYDALSMLWNTQIGILESVVSMELSTEKYNVSDFTAQKHTRLVLSKEA